MAGADIAAMLLRAALGLTLVAHGWNHVWGGGKLTGTTRWFRQIGLRPARLHAVLASVTELFAGAALILGALTPFASAAAFGTLFVALRHESSEERILHLPPRRGLRVRADDHDCRERSGCAWRRPDFS